MADLKMVNRMALGGGTGIMPPVTRERPEQVIGPPLEPQRRAAG